MRASRSWLLISALLCSGCQQKGSEPPPLPLSTGTDSLVRSLPSRIARPLPRSNGKQHSRESFSSIYQFCRLDTLDLPIISPSLLKGLDRQLQLLNQHQPRKKYRIDNLSFDVDQLMAAAEILRSRQHTKPIDLHHYLDAHQIRGEDRRGNVLFTGYYTPIIPVRAKPDPVFAHPIYERPRNWNGRMPTRAEIESKGLLEGQGLEIAFARSKADIYYMQLQGSGFVQYPDGSQRLLSYDGTNRHPYRSIEKFLLSRPEWPVKNISVTGVKSFLEEHPQLVDSVLYHNPSYTFFKAKHAMPRGAGNVPLQGEISIAVDQRYIPLGSCLLAEVPVYDRRKRRVVGHEYRILLAQDVGGRIKGPGHIDLYFGAGPDSRAKAMRMKQYGRLWLLLPKNPGNLFTLN